MSTSRSSLPALLLLLAVGCSCEGPDPRAKIEKGRPLERAEVALKHWNDTREVEPGLQALLDDASSTDAQRRRAATLHLPRARGIPKKVIDWVVSAKSGWAMLVTLGAIGPQARSGLPHVRAALDDKDRTNRVAASWAVYRITNELDGPVRRLVKELVEAPVGARQGIADSVLGIARAQPDAFRKLMGELKSDPKYAAVADELLASLPG